MKKRDEKNQEAQEKLNKLKAKKMKYMNEYKSLQKHKIKISNIMKNIKELKEQVEMIDMKGNRNDTYQERLDELRVHQYELESEINDKQEIMNKLKEKCNLKISNEGKMKLKTEIEEIKYKIEECIYNIIYRRTRINTD